MREKKDTNTTEEILDFMVHLCREMLQSGANLERVNISIRRISKCYRLREISTVYTGSALTVSVRDDAGNCHMRQENIPYTGIHLYRLGRLNLLVHEIINTKPAPHQLMDMLYETLMIKSYSNGMQLLGYLVAMISLCRIFGGHFADRLVVSLNTLVLFFLTMFFSRAKLNRIISNVIAMFFCGCSAILFTRLGLSGNISAIIITNAFYLIPGIPMVNAVRNIFCGNEMNGIIEMVKVLLEVVTIVAGLYIAFFLFGAGEGLL